MASAGFVKIKIPSYLKSAVIKFDWFENTESVIVYRDDIPNLIDKFQNKCSGIMDQLMEKHGPAENRPKSFAEGYEEYFVINPMPEVDSASVQGFCDIFLDCGCQDNESLGNFRLTRFKIHAIDMKYTVIIDTVLSWHEYQQNYYYMKGGGK